MDWWKDKQFKMLAKDLKKAKDREFKARLNLLVSYVGKRQYENVTQIPEGELMALPLGRVPKTKTQAIPRSVVVVDELSREEARAEAKRIVEKETKDMLFKPTGYSFSWPAIGGSLRKELMEKCMNASVAVGANLQMVNGQERFIITKED